MIGLSKSLSASHSHGAHLMGDVLAVPAAVVLFNSLGGFGAGSIAMSSPILPALVVGFSVAVLVSFGIRRLADTFDAPEEMSSVVTGLFCSLSTLLGAAVLSAAGAYVTGAFLILFGMTLFVCASVFQTAVTLASCLPRAFLWRAGAVVGAPSVKSQRQLTLPGSPSKHADGSTLSAVATRGFLGREEVTTCPKEAARAYVGRVVLISGAGGSIGSELTAQVLECQPRKIILYELNETALYEIHQSMLRLAAGTQVDIVPMLGSVGDGLKVRRVLREHRVQVVLHAAAYKHVPLVELNPLAGLSNNVLGTHTLVTEAAAADVERFVLISSDKAVRPINVMGASKRLCELIVSDVARRLAGKRSPVFSVVRFGNVLGSSGSVLPLFQDQVRRGGPVTVTHPDVSRFFMTVQEAVHLVLCAGSLSRGGEIFVLDMGKAVKIETLARQVIAGAGLNVKDQDDPAGEIEIKYIGLRCGEKMKEELTLSGKRSPTRHPKIFTADETGLSEFEVAAVLRALRHAVANDDEAFARENACRWVEGFCDVRDFPSGRSHPACAAHSDIKLSAQHQESRWIEAGHQ